MKLMCALVMVGLCAVTSCVTAAEMMNLDYLGRYNCQQGVDHIMNAVPVGPNRVVVGSIPYLTLVDLDSLPVNGTSSYLSRLTGYNARNLYLKDYGSPMGKYLFVSENPMGRFIVGGVPGPWGFSVIKIDGDSLTFVTRVSEPGVFFEKMDICGCYLYVAAHSKGIRIFDISNPESPVEVGRLESGFTDAYAIAVSGSLAYVADGAGGLKVVDVTNPRWPYLIGGENTSNSIGTAEAITVRDGKIYMAVGSAGLAVYTNTNSSSRQVVPTGALTEDLAWVGNYLAASTYKGPVIFDVNTCPGPTIVAREFSSRRGANAGQCRLCVGIGSADNCRVLVANWDCLDVYQLKPKSQSCQPDISPSTNRIRFGVTGGTHIVTLTNNGGADLHITGVSSTSPAFSTDYAGGTLAPCQSVSFGVSYDGSPNASGVIKISSDDLDENPLPIQVYGQTQYTDPGESAADFSLPLLAKNPSTGALEQIDTFTLSNYRGKVVWFDIYGSW